ncbi:MAG TPA: undecaprenyl-diphosphate phosphatase [Spirochaetota bacterium]|nr:undecaprenyl-diphosphate phosphatase [Spirochaetota bacterium]HPC40569.1 undecaprenyl-diphosphate phosphatase [Spirochaetota bacterium]HQF07923.1 undecaprenyl-diphosphate phosphatase [Spirochaetota bacterium]HQH96483.1 undecaprenyl-diphosphate phosphatase [Spirochaetota bacterium]HQJ69655.1 undecaprenyl-diphosphate phosphatase [Spirochaetota bacterium]
MNEIVKSIILGVVEGVTEFLPISSTGHLIIINRFIDFTGPFAKAFDVVIQLGAILSVVVYFWKRLIPFGPHLAPEKRRDVWDLWKKTIVGVIPALVLGALFGGIIKEYLFNPITVSIALIAGGIVLIYLEGRHKLAEITSVASLGYGKALAIGLIQCLAMVPGTSRSAATIIGAMFLGASRVVAAEFSFFLAIPTMCAASAYSLLKVGRMLTPDELIVLGVGFAVSFIVALAVIAGFMKFISRRDFRPFGYYRIVLGAAVLVYFLIIAG